EGAVEEGELLAAAEEPEAEPEDRVRIGRAAGVGVDAELHLAAVQALADLPLHLAHLEMALQRPVGPTPDARAVARLVVDVADPRADVEAQAVEADLQQHGAAFERLVAVVVRAHDGRIRELVSEHQPARDLKAPAWRRRPRRLRRQPPAEVVD